MQSSKTFLALVKAGLWEDVKVFSSWDMGKQNKQNELLPIINYDEILCMAEKQSVIGFVTVGLEVLMAECLPLTEKLEFVVRCQLTERRNVAMNRFTEMLVKKLQVVGINALLVKGQGLAQCHTRPLWRSSGDIDFFFSKEDFINAVELLTPLAASIVQDARYTKSYGLMIDGWFVELHGTLRNSLSSRVDRLIDKVQKDTFDSHKFRIWKNGKTDVFLPGVNNDLFFVFTHFVRHFYKEGCVVKQLCDWCRLLWIYRDEIDVWLLETRLRKAGLMGEWRAFAAVAVDYLGMPADAMPLNDSDECWHKKGGRILDFILKDRKPNKVKDTLDLAKIFPWNTLRFLPAIFFNVNGLKVKERILKK